MLEEFIWNAWLVVARWWAGLGMRLEDLSDKRRCVGKIGKVGMDGGSGGVYVFTHYLSWLTCLHGGGGRCAKRGFSWLDWA